MKGQTFSGIEVLGNMPWGTHFCQFYDTKKDLLEILVPYFKTGLESNEFCLWITSDIIDIQDATQALKKAVPEFDRYIIEKKIEILSHTDWYLKGDGFNLGEIINGWNEKLNQALERGFTGLRITGSGEWLEHHVWESFVEYEGEMNHFLADKRMIALCTYPLNKSRASDVLDVALTHDCAISKRNGEWEIVETLENKKTKAQIQKLNEELEQRVVERTRELAAANTELRREIAERKRAEGHLAEAQRLTKLGSWDYDIKTDKLTWSEELYHVFDTDKQTFIETHGSFLHLVDAEDRELALQTSRHTQQTGEPFTIEYHITTLKGEKRVIREHGYGQTDDNGKVIRLFGTAQDITEQKKAEEELQHINEELRSLSSHLQNIQENERTAIAREIHDALGQHLTALKYEVVWLNKKLPEDALLKEKVNDILSLVSEILKTVKRIAVELRPSILDDLGLIAALEWQGQEFEKRTGIKFQFHTVLKEFNRERNLSTHIFRIFQEALTNVARHAHATKIETLLEEKNSDIKLIIKDNGDGFDVDEAKNKNSLGLIGMKERAFMFQGKLTIESKKRKGTIITLKVPLQETDSIQS